MFNKRKVLYSAMVATLLSHAGGVMAAGLDLDTPASVPEIASEEISPNGSSTPLGTGNLKVKYQTSGSINADFNMIFTLSGGATWGSALSSGSLVGNPVGTPAITRVSGGTTSDTSVTFLIQAGTTAVTNANTFSLAFTVADKTGVLATAGGDIKLTANLVTTFGNVTVDSGTPAADKEETIIKSKDGELVSLTAEAKGSYLIDVAAGGLSFVSSSGSSSATAKLGTILLKDNGAKKADLSTSWTFSTSAQTGGSFLISDAPFNASITGGSGKVFIDVNNNGTYDAPASGSFDKDFLATDVTDSSAEWAFSAAALTGLASSCGTTACSIIIQADGTTTIQENSSTPTASFSIKYPNGERETSSKLLQIKRNGTVCKLYNIPASNAVDELSIRVTNTSNQEGIVKGTLQSLDGTTLFTNEDLITALAPKQTVRVDAAALKTLAGGTDWTGRAVLTLSSNIKDGYLEAFALVRNKAGGPLMNLSSGATGNGCD